MADFLSSGFSVKNGTRLASPAGFLARSATIDNNTSAYCYHPDSGLYVPPGTGRSVSFEGTRSARLEWKAPPGKTQPAAITTEEAQITFFSISTPPFSGAAAPSNQALPWITPNKTPQFKQRAGAGSVAILAGIGGQTVYLFGVQLAVVVAAVGGAGALQDSSGTQLAEIRTDTVHETWVGFGGAPIAVGLGLNLVVVGAGTVDVTANVSQA